MKKLAAALAIGVIMVGGAAFADTMQNGYGNTFVVTTANGAVLRYQFNADNTFAMTAPDGSQVSGAYEVANGQICITPAGGERGCTAYVGDKNVGDTWTQAGADGSQITVTLQAGR
jgi:hypothetical protein